MAKKQKQTDEPCEKFDEWMHRWSSDAVDALFAHDNSKQKELTAEMMEKMKKIAKTGKK